MRTLFLNAAFSQNRKLRLIFAAIAMLLLLNSCGLPGAETGEGGTTGVTGSGTSSEFWVGVKIPDDLADTTNAPRFKVYQTDFPSASSNPSLPDFVADRCVANPDDSDDKEIFCTIHADELDLQFHGLTLVVNAHADQCNYMEFDPSSYWDAVPGTGPRNANIVWTQEYGTIAEESSIDGHTGSTWGPHSIDDSGELVCGFDYSSVFEGGKNCCEGGNYSFTRRKLTDDSASEDVTVSTDGGGFSTISPTSEDTKLTSDTYVKLNGSLRGGIASASDLDEDGIYRYEESSGRLYQIRPTVSATAVDDVTFAARNFAVTSGVATMTLANHGLRVGDIVEVTATNGNTVSAGALSAGQEYEVMSRSNNTITIAKVLDPSAGTVLVFSSNGNVSLQFRQISFRVADVETEDGIEWTGDWEACIVSGHEGWEQKNAEGWLNGVIHHVPEGNVTDEFKLTRQFEEVSAFNFNLANFYPNMDVTDPDTWPTPFKNPAEVQYSDGSEGDDYYALDVDSERINIKPFFTAKCLDEDHEIRARIRVAILDWNTKDELDDFFADEDHSGQDPDYGGDWDGTNGCESTPFGDSETNDMLDFEDLETWAVAGGTTCDGITFGFGYNYDTDSIPEPYPVRQPFYDGSARASAASLMSMSSVPGLVRPQRQSTNYRHTLSSKFFNANDAFMGDRADVRRMRKKMPVLFRQLTLGY